MKHSIKYMSLLQTTRHLIITTTNFNLFTKNVCVLYIQGDQKFSVHLKITIQKVSSYVQIVPRQSPDIY